MRYLGLVALALLITAGCDDTLFPGNERVYEPNWLGVQVFTFDHCAQCHPSLAEPAFPAAIEEDIRNEDGVYVVPGDPEASLLWRVLSSDDRLTGDPPKMPLGRPLRPERVAFVREWILAGAPL